MTPADNAVRQSIDTDRPEEGPRSRPVLSHRHRNVRERLLRALVTAPRWLLLTTLVFAPWAYGSTRPWAIRTLSVLLAFICLLWLIECVVRHRRPHVPPFPVAAGAGLVLQGWWMTLNSRFVFDTGSETLLPRTPWLPIAPGSADAATSASAMFLYSGLIGILWFACDLSERAIWRKRIWVTLALTSVSVAAFGVLQKIGGDSVLAWVWESGKRDPSNNFAMFRYRGNAGAFLNLALPLLAGLAFLGFRRPGHHWGKAFWLTALFVLLAGIQLNPSRASWCIALAIALGLGGTIAWYLWRRRRDNFQVKQLLINTALLLLVLGAVATVTLVGGWETSWRRMRAAGVNPANRSPTEIYRRMISGAGVMGFGPGTFPVVFPTYQRTHDFGGRDHPAFWVTGSWQQAHEDYFQTVIEWGWWGTFLWAVLILGGLTRGLRGYFHGPDGSSDHWFLFCSALAVIGTLVHSLVDFPLQVASIQLYVAVLLGICWRPNRQINPNEITQGQFPHRLSHHAGSTQPTAT